MIRRPPRSTLSSSSAASDVYKRQVFKVVENNLTKDGKLILYSLNPVYEPYEVHVNEVKEIWKFVNYISSELPDPVLPEKQLIQAVAGMKHDLERIKAKLGKDIVD